MNPSETSTKQQATRASSGSDRGGKPRDDRLKAALKANLARRKAQARARADARSQEPQPQGTPDND